MLLDKVNNYIRKQIKKLDIKERKELTNFAIFLGRQK